jgi:diaminopimelate decarboxylase
MSTTSFATKEQLEKIIAGGIPTPFCIYDEAGIRGNCKRINAAFAAFPSYINHYAVKALPNPHILKILKSEGMGADCSSGPELSLAKMAGITGGNIMFTSNGTPAPEYKRALELGAVINLDDITHIEFLEKEAYLPELVCLRFNPGPEKLGNSIIGNPVEAKYGFTRAQILEGYQILQKKGVKRFALHAMVASNEINVEYHVETGRLLFAFAVEILEKTGIKLEFINLGGGVGIPYKPEDNEVDIEYLGESLKKLYDEIAVPAGLGKMGIRTEWGRFVTGPHGILVSQALHKKDIYRKYIGLDSTGADFMRPLMYGAYHHIVVAGKESVPAVETYDIVGSLCENSDKFAVQRKLPKIDTVSEGGAGDLVLLLDAGAHGRAMGFNYNAKLRCAELLLREDGSVQKIRRAETEGDYFATLELGKLWV